MSEDQQNPTTDYDVIIAGSGFGGSVITYRLAKAGLKVLLLERGQTWAPGNFPRYPKDFHRALWDPSEDRYGLFNLWSFPGIDVVTASGLGGGSLIYANVLLRKDREWFRSEAGKDWPLKYADLEPHYERVEKMLGAAEYPDELPVAKFAAFRDASLAARKDWRKVPLAVAFGESVDRPAAVGVPLKDQQNLHGVPRISCRLCGECDVGCNYGSKHTLDLNYLTRAREYGAELKTLAQVTRVAPGESGSGYAVKYVNHLPNTEYGTADLKEQTVTAARLVLSMGSPGSPFVLLESREHFPEISGMLGRRFAGNGDYLGFVSNAKSDLDPYHGPVITSAVRVPDYTDGAKTPGLYVQDAGFPNFLAHFAESFLYNRPALLKRIVIFAWQYLRRLFGRRRNPNMGRVVSDLLGSGSFTARSLPLLGMGLDTPDGKLYLDRGRLQSTWTMRTSKKYFKQVENTMRGIAKQMGGRFVKSPMSALGKVITVHPLGGCPMGNSPEDGVVDSFGEVFNYPGLYVADGSVMPGPVGANPSLTIAAVADRTADRILSQMGKNNE